MDPRDSPLARRRSPGWVRQLGSPQLHALALRLRREFMTNGISDRQDFLLGAVLSELEYRHRRALRVAPRSACVCELCLPPEIPDGDFEGPEEPF